ncbi:MAG: spore coat protein [Bacillota bacterium]|nr:spore coat protein [Bacillota bacterium]
MTNLTSKELTAIEDQLKIEQTMIKKLRAYAEITSDTTVKNTCSGWANKHQQHYDTLLNMLG